MWMAYAHSRLGQNFRIKTSDAVKPTGVLTKRGTLRILFIKILVINIFIDKKRKNEIFYNNKKKQIN